MQKFEVRGGLYALLAAIIFLILAVAHGLRAYYGWPLTWNAWEIPIWFSWLVAFIGFIMAISAVRKL